MGKSQREVVKPGELVLSAIKKLTVNTGWTARTIVKFIKMEYAVQDSRIGGKISRALKRGVRLGLLQMDRGRYRLKDMSKLARSISNIDVRPREYTTSRQVREHSRSGGGRRFMRMRSRSPPMCRRRRY